MYIEKIYNKKGANMEENYSKISDRELIEIYKKNKEFIAFLEKEIKNSEKTLEEK